MVTMFSFSSTKSRSNRVVKSSKKPHRSHSKVSSQQKMDSSSSVPSPSLTSPIIRLEVGPDQRLFAAHEEILCLSPFFDAALKGYFWGDEPKKVVLPEDIPEVLSCILEYLYKGDYYPRLFHNKRRNTWDLEDAQDSQKPGGRGGVESTIYHHGVGGDLLKDTAIYCAAGKLGLEELQRLALRKQGLQSGISVGTILRSARYAYDNTPENDSRLRAHYLTLIVRSRKIFKRSGTMGMEMQMGGSALFFDLFVAMCNHIDDTAEAASKGMSPRTI